jgi:hypothetical protein
MGCALAMEYVYRSVLPWRKIFDDMKDRGCAYSRQASMIGLEWSSYQRFVKDGVEPRHSIGAAILELHTKLCGAELTRLRQTEGGVLT